ncbi:MAG: DUF748 domain-containing protein [Chitinophagaceae bacterium]
MEKRETTILIYSYHMSLHPSNPPAWKRVFRNRKTNIFLGIIALLVIFRLLLPYIVLHYANKSLANVKGYFGHIDDVDISLYRGAYQINDMYLNKKDERSGKQSGFFKVANIDLSVEWRALFHGRLVGELEFDAPKLIFTENKVELADVKHDTSDFRKILKDFMPLKLNRFAINNGELHYADNGRKPRVDISLKKIQLTAENLENVADSGKLLPSTVVATAAAYEGTLNLNMKLNPLANAATFDLNADIKNVNLVLLNDFLMAYGNFDVHRGNFGMYSELAAKDGAFKGYVKPIIKGLDVVGPEDKKDGFFHKLWESLVGGVGVVFRNQRKDQIATRVSLEGNFKDPKTNTLDAIWEVLRNAFIQALMPSVDNQININSVDEASKKDDRNLLQRVFGKKEKENGEKKKEKKKPVKKASKHR